jgi:pimeloyl-[acyl-carrier protein] methyl ester esterase
MVLLHGWGSTAKVWRSVADDFHRTYDCYLPELPGHGDGRLALWGPAQLTGQLINEINRPATWLAWSLGALIAMQAALQAPDQVERLILVAGTPSFVQTAEWDKAMPLSTFDQFLDEYRTNPRQAQKKFIALQAHGDRNGRQVRQQLEAAATPADSKIGWGLDMLRSLNLSTDLAKIACPIHCLYGANDALVPASIDAAMQTLAEVTVWPETGHAPFLSDPERFVQWVAGVMHG